MKIGIVYRGERDEECDLHFKEIIQRLADEAKKKQPPLRDLIRKIEGVAGVSVGSSYISLRRAGMYKWSSVLPEVVETLMCWLYGKCFPVDLPYAFEREHPDDVRNCITQRIENTMGEELDAWKPPQTQEENCCQEKMTEQNFMEFVILVRDMRVAQKGYEKNRHILGAYAREAVDRDISWSIEKLVDEKIERLTRDLKGWF